MWIDPEKYNFTNKELREALNKPIRIGDPPQSVADIILKERETNALRRKTSNK